MKNKKSLIAIITVLLVAVIGATFAYFQSSVSFENLFTTGTYKVVTTETFESPNNWAPGQEIPKTITTTNEGTIPAAVRVSYTEQWLDENNQDITSQVANGTAIINLDNKSEWEKEGNYYYYKHILGPNETTTSFIKSVTLNPELGEDIACTTSQDGLTKTCEASNPATGATYKLTLTKETVQADKYKEVWNTNVKISEKIKFTLPSDRTKDNLQLGDEICLNGDTTECFYFVRYNGEDIVLLSKYDLNVGDRPHGTENNLQDSETKILSIDMENNNPTYSYGAVAFSQTAYWYDDYESRYGESIYDSSIVTEPNFDDLGYNTPGYSIAYYVEKYRNILTEYGASIKETRLLLSSEILSVIPNDACWTENKNISCESDSFIFSETYWLGDNTRDSETSIFLANKEIFGAPYNQIGRIIYQLPIAGVRPVIVITKESIE